MAPRGKSGGPKSDIQKCLRCSIILHETDVAKHDLECLPSDENSFLSPTNVKQTYTVAAASSAVVSPEIDGVESFPRQSLSTPESRNSTSERLHETSLGGGDAPTPDRNNAKNASYSFNTSALNSSSAVSVYGFVDPEKRLHATVKSLKSSSSKTASTEVPPHPKQGRILLVHPVTMTLADLTIGCRVIVSLEEARLRERSNVSSNPLRDVVGPVVEDSEDPDESEAVVCTAWPSEVVPQFGVVPAEETKKELGMGKNGSQRLLVSSLPSSSVSLASSLTLSLVSRTRTGGKLVSSPAFLKFVERDIRGRCFIIGNQSARYGLKYFGQEMRFLVHLTDVAPSSVEPSNSDFAKVTLDFGKLDILDVDKAVGVGLRPFLSDAVSSTPKPDAATNRGIARPPKRDSKADSNRDSDADSVYLVSDKTKIICTSSEGPDDAEQDAEQDPSDLVRYADLGGLSEKISEILDWIEVPLLRPAEMTRLGAPLPRGVLLYGPSGVGKTKLADAILNETRCFPVRIRASDLFSFSSSTSETRLQDMLSSASSKAPSLILLDDVDLICQRKKEKGGSESERKTRSAIVDSMDRLIGQNGGHVMFLGTTNSLESVDPALRRPGRFDREIEIPVPTPNQRCSILQTLLRNSAHSLTASETKEIADRCHGYVGADLVALTQKAALAALKTTSLAAAATATTTASTSTTPATTAASMNPALDYEALKLAMREIQPSAMKEVAIQVPNVRWEDIGGQSELKQKLKQAVEWPLKHPEAFVRMGIVPPRGLLMYGPPGCSKTMIAKAMAKESGLNFLSVKGPELFDKYVGESERAVREIFRRARAAAPAIIFFDEIDALAARRGGGGGGGVGDRVLAQMLTEMDGVQQLDGVTVIAATNRPDMVDKALLRPGRMDRVVYVPLPDADTRAEIFRLRISKMPVDGESVAIEDLVSRTEGLSGAEVVAVCHEAAMAGLAEGISVDKICRRHFDAALEMVKPQVDQGLIHFYENYHKTKDAFKL